MYLHGFQSSADSTKGTALKDFLARTGRGHLVELPTLPPRPALARQWLRQRMRTAPLTGVLGSSLGGCYAHWMAGEFGIKAVLINPATEAHLLMREHLGRNENPVTQEHFTLTEEDMDALQQMDQQAIRRPEDILCLLQQGDEVLDWSQAAERYADCRLHITAGGSHSFDNWSKALPLACDHLQCEA